MRATDFAAPVIPQGMEMTGIYPCAEMPSRHFCRLPVNALAECRFLPFPVPAGYCYLYRRFLCGTPELANEQLGLPQALLRLIRADILRMFLTFFRPCRFSGKYPDNLCKSCRIQYPCNF